MQAVDRPVFNVKIPLEGAPITNQRSSGRCWLFAATNVFRVPLMKKYNLKEFELSQAYLFYWDKIEKANWFMEKIIETAEEDLSSRLVQKLLEDPVTDGGQWDMVANLVGKYGLVPHDIYPDNFSAQNSAKMNWLVTVKLREHALTLRRLAQSQPERLARQKDDFLKEIHSLVTIMLGPPPSPKEVFHWEYYDADGKFQEVYDSPQGFARQASAQLARGDVDPRRMLSLVNDPRNEYSRLLTVDKLGNVVGGRPITYVNVDMKVSSYGEYCVSTVTNASPDDQSRCDCNASCRAPCFLWLRCWKILRCQAWGDGSVATGRQIGIQHHTAHG